MRELSRTTIISLIISALLALSLYCLSQPPAYANEIDDAKQEKEAIQEKLETLSNDIDIANLKIEELQSQIDELAPQAQSSQQSIVELKDKQSKAMISLYKIGGIDGLLEMVCVTNSINDLMKTVQYTISINNQISSLLEQQRKLQVELDSQIKQLDDKKNEQMAVIAAAEQSIQDAHIKIDELETQIDELEQARIERYKTASSLLRAEVFDTQDTDSDGWSSGVASAYGGWSDASVADNARTATGDAVTESSMGVAVPMAWNNFRSYFGRKVEISYNGKSVIATVNDCGGMGGGSRSLDLQPGVFKAFGANSCQEWGLRNVKYRFL